jgi:hypothetical protein
MSRVSRIFAAVIERGRAGNGSTMALAWLFRPRTGATLFSYPSTWTVRPSSGDRTSAAYSVVSENDTSSPGFIDIHMPQRMHGLGGAVARDVLEVIAFGGVWCRRTYFRG